MAKLYQVKINTSSIKLSCRVGSFEFMNEEVIPNSKILNQKDCDELAKCFPNIFRPLFTDKKMSENIIVKNEKGEDLNIQLIPKRSVGRPKKNS